MNLDWIEAGPEHPLLFRLYTTGRQQEVEHWGWDEAQLQTFLQMQYRFQQQSYAMQYPGSRLYIIQLDGQDAGKVHVAQTDEEWVLVDIAVLPEQRGSGIGSRIIRRIQEQAAEQGKPVRLTVAAGNPAARLYERLEFKLDSYNELHAVMRWYPKQ
ncbi:GNAT family N-acetyltransferase [Paenibacillus sp. y28]|uniref:GNAT family N-acetyltransferase n=1 Tax=Paenibacillus sp. y28 TaxID=3129110 RepID=UPI003019499A